MVRASTRVRKNARSMRREPTRAEARLWSWLRDRRFFGHKFRRQHPAAGYILDFYCPELKLAIELDRRHHQASYMNEYESLELSRCEHSASRSYDYQTSCWCVTARQLEVVVPSSGPSGHLLPA